jgi:hypothetical protein
MERWGELRESGLDPDGSYGANAYVRIGEDDVDGVRVSTVWLGLDHGFKFGEDALPVIFETMIFGGQFDNYQIRYHTEDEARRGHAEVVADLRAGMTPGWALGNIADVISDGGDIWPDAWRSRPDADPPRQIDL